MTEVQQKRRFVDKEGKTACYYDNGYVNRCWNGDSCPFSHDVEFIKSYRLQRKRYKKLNKKEKEKKKEVVLPMFNVETTLLNGCHFYQYRPITEELCT